MNNIFLTGSINQQTKDGLCNKEKMMMIFYIHKMHQTRKDNCKK